MRSTILISHIRERSRSARERSNHLRLTSRHLRDSLENLRAGAGMDHAGAADLTPLSHPIGPEPDHLFSRTPLEFAALMRERACKIRQAAQLLCRHATDLRSQAGMFRARSENLRNKPVTCT